MPSIGTPFSTYAIWDLSAHTPNSNTVFSGDVQ